MENLIILSVEKKVECNIMWKFHQTRVSFAFDVASIFINGRISGLSGFLIIICQRFNQELGPYQDKKNLPASRAHSHRALRAQLASRASLSAPRARDSIVALRAP